METFSSSPASASAMNASSASSRPRDSHAYAAPPATSSGFTSPNRRRYASAAVTPRLKCTPVSEAPLLAAVTSSLTGACTSRSSHGP